MRRLILVALLVVPLHAQTPANVYTCTAIRTEVGAMPLGLAGGVIGMAAEGARNGGQTSYTVTMRGGPVLSVSIAPAAAPINPDPISAVLFRITEGKRVVQTPSRPLEHTAKTWTLPDGTALPYTEAVATFEASAARVVDRDVNGEDLALVLVTSQGEPACHHVSGRTIRNLLK